MNYLLPEIDELSMHCSANVGRPRRRGRAVRPVPAPARPRLSADPRRQLIGDDEHAWTADGVSNFEGGCYAKLIDLDKEAEPVIAAALSMPGTLIENVPGPARQAAGRDRSPGTGPDRRFDHREHPLLLPAWTPTPTWRRAPAAAIPENHRAAHRRCLRRAAADLVA